jgi:TetR/AcrR family transcriptional repressor of nem operon
MGKPKAFNEQQAVEKALQLFWCKGYEATSMQNIVDTLGLNRSSIYHTFVDKRTLFLQSLNQYQKQQASALIDFLDQAPPTVSSLQALFLSVVDESVTDTDRKGCFMVNTTLEMANRDNEVQRIVVSNNQLVENALSRFLDRMQQHGTLATHKSTRQLAAFLMSSIAGLRVSAVANPERSNLMAIVEGVMTVFT